MLAGGELSIETSLAVYVMLKHPRMNSQLKLV